MTYDQQLRLKEDRVSSLLKPHGIALSGSRASPDLRYYRNKMEFSFGDVYPPEPQGRHLLLGLKPKGQWYRILDLRECHLLSPEAPVLLESVRAWARESGLFPYNSRRRTGFLRHLVLREAKNSLERMVLLVTSPGDLPREGFLEAVRRAYPATTVLWGRNNKLSDTAEPDSIEVLEGPGYITERLRLDGRELRFRISPRSFFQTNTHGAEALYGLVRTWVRESEASRVLDLYCGGGGIGLSLAGVCREIIGAEQDPTSVEDARINAALNGIPEAKFFCGPVETLLKSLLAMKPDAMVVDPPRAGLAARTIEALLEGAANDLIYVSCNPEALARDLSVLGAGYRAVRAEVVDLFPHTDHVETAVWLRRA